MSKAPIDTAHDADLRLSQHALQRAAQRARELAARTNTAIVISRHGVIEHIPPQPEPVGRSVLEPSANYGDK